MSFATQDARQEILWLGFKELRVLGFKLDDVRGFKERRIIALVRDGKPEACPLPLSRIESVYSGHLLNGSGKGG